MIIWEKVTIQDSSAKFTLALDNNHSGLQLTDTNDALANLSLNKLKATDLALGDTTHGLEYINNDNSFIFHSPVDFQNTVAIDGGLTTSAATIGHTLNVGGAATITGKLTVNDDVEISSTKALKTKSVWNDGDLELSANSTNFKLWVNRSKVLHITNTAARFDVPVQVNGSCIVSNKIQSSNLGDLNFAPVLWVDTGTDSQGDWVSVYLFTQSNITYELKLIRTKDCTVEQIKELLSPNTYYKFYISGIVPLAEVHLSLDDGSSWTSNMLADLDPSGGEDGVYIKVQNFVPNLENAYFAGASVIAVQPNCGAVVSEWEGPYAESRIRIWSWAVQQGYNYFYFNWGVKWYGGALQNMAESVGIKNDRFVGTVYFTVEKPYNNSEE